MIRLVIAIALAWAALALAINLNVWLPLGVAAGWGAMDMVNEFCDWRDER